MKSTKIIAKTLINEKNKERKSRIHLLVKRKSNQLRKNKKSLLRVKSKRSMLQNIFLKFKRNRKNKNNHKIEKINTNNKKCNQKFLMPKKAYLRRMIKNHQ